MAQAEGDAPDGMITRAECIPYLLSATPGFRATWDAHLRYWEGEDAGITNDIGAYVEYVVDLLQRHEREQLPSIFSAIEALMVRGDAAVHDAVATGFLESMCNRASSGDVMASDFTPFLGPVSRAFCCSYDEWTGVRTEGV
jgi:hypothetical protein